MKKKLLRILLIIITIYLILNYLLPHLRQYTMQNKNYEYLNEWHQDNNPTYDNVSATTTNTGTIISRLKELSKQDSRVEDIINNYNNYPEDILDMLSRNIDMLDFVLDYPLKKGQNLSDTIGTLKNGEVPLLLQYDKRWGYANYGDSSIAVSGCAPTSLSMVISYLKKDNTITPYTVAKYAEDNGYYLANTGTSWSLMTEGAKHFGVIGREIPLTISNIENELNQGHPIICSMRQGDFTTIGHFIVLTKIVDGKIKVNDPNSKSRSSILWDYSRIESQIKNLWAFSLK